MKSEERDIEALLFASMNTAKRVEPEPEPTTSQDPPKGWDGRVTELEFENYFSAYSCLSHQVDMLSDTVRMDSYHSAIRDNALNFEDKVVLDVGSGTGILALFAAQAGARKVYAVEATDAAKFAKRLVAHNRLENVVTVIQDTIEQVELPERVDIIVSEFMGHFLLRESMLDSVLYARDKFLKSDGAIYPSVARMYLAPASCRFIEYKEVACSQEIRKSKCFLDKVRTCYGVDLDCFSRDLEKEIKERFVGTSEGVEVEPHELLGTPVCVKEFDLLTSTINDVKSVSKDFTFDISPLRRESDSDDLEDLSLTMFVGWFSVHFTGSPSEPAYVDVECSNEPRVGFDTHWGQEAFLVNPSVAVHRGDKMEGHFEMTRRPDNWRLYNVNIDYSICSNSGQKGARHSSRYQMA